VISPFENEDSGYVVLVNAENQHSLWHAFNDVPAGWTVVHEADTRQNCLDYVTRHWTDMRPASLIKEMSRHALALQERRQLARHEPHR
jgi:MbtH protein